MAGAVFDEFGLPVEPHEVSKGKAHIIQNKCVPIEWFVTTASQSRIWLKLLSDDSNKVGICLLCRSTQVHATTSCRSEFATTCDSSYVLKKYKVSSTTLYMVSATPVLLCTRSITPVRTTQFYSNTTLHYKILDQKEKIIQYYSTVRSNTPIPASTTRYYSSQQRTTPVLLCTTKY